MHIHRPYLYKLLRLKLPLSALVVFLILSFPRIASADSISIISPTSTVTVGSSIQFTATVSSSTAGTAVWSISPASGSGSISTTGIYTAPSTIPTNPSVQIIATLSTDSTVQSSTTIQIVALPVITSTTPSSLPMGENNPILFRGTGFLRDTAIYMNGSAQTTVYLSPTLLLATMSAEPGVASPLTVVAQNSVSGGSSAVYSLPLGAPTNTYAAVVNVPVRAIPDNFLGFSHEWGDAEGTYGWNAQGTNYIFRQLLSNLMDSPNSPFLIRIGGGSTDDSSTVFSVEAFNELNAALPGVKFTTGVKLGNALTSTPAVAEQQALSYLSNMTPGILDSIEIGNETDDYQYQSSRAYTFDVFNSKYSQWTAGILQTVAPATPQFTGPSWALMRTLLNNNYWSNFKPEKPNYLQLFINAQSANTKTITQHFYSGLQGGLPPTFLLGTSALQYLNPGNPVPFWAPSVLGWAANLAHQNHETFRVNEINSVDGGGQPGTSDSFSAALWAIDTMFEFAAAGVDGVNFHGAEGGERIVTPGQTCLVQGVTYQAPCTPRPLYAPFTFHSARTGPQGQYSYGLDSVNPLYYGFYFFHLAVPNGSSLLPVTLQSPAHVKVWATRDHAGTVRIAVINKDINFSGNISVLLPGYGDANRLLLTDANGYTGTLYYADDTSIIGTTGITVGGQTFDGSTDGTIQGTQTTDWIEPSNGVYTVTLQPATAVLLTLQPQHQ